ncbi:c-type cytochrome [Psychromonas sp. KJ10-10]|uniref:c-type cytochrome n=1 Tax=Psychromonas sp. KJ10-10 TaxID=3391823 RepID=UPI0039B6141B
MKILSKVLLVGLVSISTTSVFADVAQSEKHAIKATELRQSIFSLISSNMGSLGAMAKGQIPVDATVVEKNALRINQLSLMLGDYFKTDTSSFNVTTDAKNSIWTEQDKFATNIENLTSASSALMVAAQSKDEGAIKKAIGGVGKTCGGCHDDFRD